MTETVRIPVTGAPWQIPDQRRPRQQIPRQQVPHQQSEAEEWQLLRGPSPAVRPPLTALRTEVELALLGNRDAGELRAALMSAAHEIRRLCRRADDLLLLAQS